MAAEDGVDKVVADFLRSLALGHLGRLDGEGDAALDGGKFVVPERLAFLDQLHQLALGAGGDGNDDVGIAWDGVTHIAALPFRQSGVTDEHSLAHKAAHEFVGIGAAFVDFQSAMSSAQSFEGDAPRLAVFEGFNFQILHGGGNVDAARAADIELALSLAIEVEEHFPLQLALLQAESAKHARFLVGSNKGFQRAVLEGLVLHDGHDGSYAHAIVSTQRGAAGLYPVAIDVGGDGVGEEVVGAVGRLLRHHIHVGLQDEALAAFQSFRSGLAHEDVTGFVLPRLYAGVLTPLEQEGLNLFEMA